MLPLHHLWIYTPHTHTTRPHPWATRARGPPHTTQATHTCAPRSHKGRVERPPPIGLNGMLPLHHLRTYTPARTQHDHTHGRLGREAHHTQHKQRTHVRQPHGKNRTPFSPIQRRWISIILRADTTSDVQEHLSLCRGASTLECLSRTGRIELPSPPYKGGGFPVSYVQTKRVMCKNTVHRQNGLGPAHTNNDQQRA